MRILAETAYPRSTAGPRVRLVQFEPSLSREGVQLTYRPTLTEQEYSVVVSGSSAPRKAAVLSRAMLRLARFRPPEPADLSLVYRLRFLLPVPRAEPRAEVDVYDFDDALFVGSILDRNRRFGWLKQEAERCRAYLARARCVVAGNAYLASYAKTLNRNVEVVPSCIDPAAYRERRHQNVETPTVGWIGSQSTAAFLHPLFPVFERLNSDRLRARLVIVGADPGIRRPWLEFRPWSESREVDDLAAFDIGVMPMPDNAWTRGKCGYKVLQYFGAGVPAIASPVGVNGELISSGRGRLAETEQEWSAALQELLEDADLRRELGQSGREHARNNYSYERWAPELASLFATL
jgi:glycosyltransferase involved in cell wall biosynthesis